MKSTAAARLEVSGLGFRVSGMRFRVFGVVKLPFCVFFRVG